VILNLFPVKNSKAKPDNPPQDYTDLASFSAIELAIRTKDKMVLKNLYQIEIFHCLLTDFSFSFGKFTP